jgi:hypothetical protein
VRNFVAFVLVVLFLAAGFSTVMARDLESTFTPNRVLSRSGDLEEFVDQAFNEQMTARQVQATYERLTERQKERVGILIARRAGIPLAEWHRLIESENGTIQQSPGATWTSSVSGFPGELWRQPIEAANGRVPMGFFFCTLL